MTKGGGGSGASGWSGSAASAADAGAVGGDQGGSSDVTGATAGSYPEGNSGAPPGVAGGTSGGNSGAPPGVAGGSSGGNSGAPPEIAGGSSGGNSDAPPGIAGGNPGGNSGALGGTAGGSSGGNSGAPGGTAGDNGTAGGAGSAVGTSTTCSQCPDFALCGTDGSCGSCTSNADCEQTDECSLGFCVPTTLPDWRLEIAPADWEALNTELDTELYVPCSLGANGIEYSEGCRVRLHGGSSREYDKRSFHFVFPNDVDHPGLTRKIILRSEWNDPSFMRNRLALETFRFYTQIPASRSRYVRLTLNGEYYGLFLEVERIGKEFLRHNGRSDEQSLYEADPIEGLEPGAAGMVPLPDEATYRAAYDRKIDEDGSIDDLVALIEDVVYADNEGYVNEGAPPTQHIREAVDIDAFVDYLAVLGAMRSSDQLAVCGCSSDSSDDDSTS